MAEDEPATVLIVEDEGITRMIVQRMVEALGAQACCVEDGRTALAVSAARRVDLVLLDCMSYARRDKAVLSTVLACPILLSISVAARAAASLLAED